MKEEVIEVLRSKKQPQEKYNQLMNLLKKNRQVNQMSLNYYNRSGFSASNLSSLAYDVQKLYGITDKELMARPAVMRKVIKDEEKTPEDKSKTKEEVKAPEDQGEKQEDDQFLGVWKQLMEIDLEKANYNTEIRPLALSLANYTTEKFEDQKKASLVAYLSAVKARLEEEAQKKS